MDLTFQPVAQNPLHQTVFGSSSSLHQQLFLAGSPELSPSTLDLQPDPRYIETHLLRAQSPLHKKSCLKQSLPTHIGSTNRQRFVHWSDPIATFKEIPTRDPFPFLSDYLSNTQPADSISASQSILSAAEKNILSAGSKNKATTASRNVPPATPISPTIEMSSPTEGSLTGPFTKPLMLNDYDFGSTSLSISVTPNESQNILILAGNPQARAPATINFNCRHLDPNYQEPRYATNPQPGPTKAPQTTFPFHHNLHHITPHSNTSPEPTDSVRANLHLHKRRDPPSPTDNMPIYSSKAVKLDEKGDTRRHRQNRSPSRGSSVANSSSASSEYSSQEEQDYPDTSDGATDSEGEDVSMGGTSTGFDRRMAEHRREQRRRRNLKFVPKMREIVVNKLRVTTWSNELMRFIYLMNNDKFNQQNDEQLQQCLETIDKHKADPYITPAVLIESKLGQHIKVFRHAPYDKAVKEVANRIYKTWRAMCQDNAAKK